MTRDWTAAALSAGFTFAGPLNVSTLTVHEDVRAMCAQDRCNRYAKCWTCPPGCGTLESCQTQMASYDRGLLVQSLFPLEDPLDYPAMLQSEAAHHRLFVAFCQELRQAYPQLLALGSGGCRLCETCTYPTAPCRLPQQAVSSMEAYGLLVSQVLKANGMGYHYGPNSISFTGCYLF